MVIACSAATAQVTLRLPTTLDVPDSPIEAIRGDFNNDGKIDVATANLLNVVNQQVTILINDGSGTFTPPNIRNFGSTTSPVDIAVGDFNEDGNLDVVVCSRGNDNFSLLLGDGAGNLAAPITIAAGDQPNGIAVGDLNKDGNLDVVIVHRGTPDDLYIFPGNGAGGFAAPLIFTGIANTGWDVAVADFNNDGNPDCAVSTSGVYTVQIWLGDGAPSPTFNIATTVGGFSANPEVNAIDLDADGDADILSRNAYAMNTGNGTFLPRVVLGGYEEFSVGLLNNDSYPDIAATDVSTNQANTVVFLGNGSGFTRLAKFETTAYNRGQEIIDINNDGVSDLIGAGFVGTQGKVDILIGEGNGYFSNSITKYATLTPADPRDIVKGDFNEDGKMDVAMCHTGNLVSVYLGEVGGRFTKTGANHATGTNPQQVITLDYNQDLHTDLAVFNLGSNSISVLAGNGTGSFSLAVTIPVTSATGSQILTGDFNNDTRPDLVLSGATNNQVSFFPGTGSGFGAVVNTVVSGNVDQIAAGEFTGDANLDLVVNVSNLAVMVLLTGSGTGTFAEGSGQYSVANTRFLVTDIDGDTKQDVVVYSNSASGSDYFINDGTGTFSGFSITSALAGNSFGYEDMNSDGMKDLVVGAQDIATTDAGQVVVFAGTGTGISNTVLLDKDFSGGHRVILQDVNADGTIDLIVSSSNTQEDYFGTLINTTIVVGCPAITQHPLSQSGCTGTGVVFTVTATGNTPLSYQWRKGVTPIGGATSSSLNLSSLALTDAGTYNCVVTNGCGVAISNSANLTVNATPSSPGVTPSSRCGVGTVILVASGATDGDYRWYDSPTNPIPLAGQTNSAFTTPSLTLTTTYYVSILINGCESTRVSVVATIHTIPSAPGVVAASRCGAGSVSLGATGATDGDYRWYDSPTNPTPLVGQTNGTFVTPSLASTTTYYVSIFTGGCESTRTSVAATINTVPAAPGVVPASRCGDGSVNLGAIGATGGDYRWYDSPTNPTPLVGQTNGTFVTPSLSSTTTYYVSIFTGGCESARTSVAATINSIPAPPGVVPASRCGPGSVSLGATGAIDGDYRWYDSPTIPTPLTGETGSSFATPSLSSTTTYYVSIFTGGCESTRTSVTATIITIPSAPGVIPASRCGTGSVSLGATGAPSGDYRWYDSATNPTPLTGETGSSFATPSLTAATTYHVSIFTGGCESTRTSVIATINTIPTAPGVVPASRCGTGSLNLGATGASSGDYRWYDSPTNPTPLTGETGSSITTPSLTSTTTYYVSILTGGCESLRTSVTATVNNVPPQPVITPSIPPVNGTIEICSTTPLTLSGPSGFAGYLWSSGETSEQITVSITGNYTVSVTNASSCVSAPSTAVAVVVSPAPCSVTGLAAEPAKDIVIYNAVSPNGDGLNDTFLIENVDVLPGTKRNKLTLYDREGKLVFEINNYDNASRVFRGISNTGAELPSGTYYYVLEFSGSEPKRTGFLSLRR